MKLYITKEPHKMLSGHMTVKYRWWLKNGENIQRFPAQIQHQTEMLKARKEFIEAYPNGKVLIKDMTK